MWEFIRSVWHTITSCARRELDDEIERVIALNEAVIQSHQRHEAAPTNNSVSIVFSSYSNFGTPNPTPESTPEPEPRNPANMKRRNAVSDLRITRVSSV